MRAFLLILVVAHAACGSPKTARSNQRSANESFALPVSPQPDSLQESPSAEAVAPQADAADTLYQEDGASKAPSTEWSKFPQLGCEDPQAASLVAPRVWLLTSAQYLNTVEQTLGAVARNAASVRSRKFDVSDLGVVDSDAVGEIHENAEGVVTAFLAQNDLGSLCTFEPAGCLRGHLAPLVESLWRRPVTTGEMDRIMTVGGELGDSVTGLRQKARLVLKAALHSPHFLYRSEIGAREAGAPADAPLALTAFELASELSYTFTDAPPDATLRADAQSGKLGDRRVVLEHAMRLLKLSGQSNLVTRFFAKTFHLDSLDSLALDPSRYAAYGAAAPHLRSEIDTFVTDTLWQDGGRIETLFSAPYSFLNDELGALYGVEVESDVELVKTTLPATERAGLLTLPGVVAALNEGKDLSPFRRGKLMREALFCQTLPPPPAAALDPFADAGGSDEMSVREIIELHSKQPACRSCHVLLDGPGFAFLNFDAAGVYRQAYRGKALDSSGEISGIEDAPFTFTDGVDFARKVATTSHLKVCLGTRLYEATMGRAIEKNADACQVAPMMRSLEKNGGSLVELVQAIVTSDVFYLRKGEAK